MHTAVTTLLKQQQVYLVAATSCRHAAAGKNSAVRVTCTAVQLIGIASVLRHTRAGSDELAVLAMLRCESDLANVEILYSQVVDITEQLQANLAEEHRLLQVGRCGPHPLSTNRTVLMLTPLHLLIRARCTEFAAGYGSRQSCCSAGAARRFVLPH